MPVTWRAIFQQIIQKTIKFLRNVALWGATEFATGHVGGQPSLPQGTSGGNRVWPYSCLSLGAQFLMDFPIFLGFFLVLLVFHCF
jgi:hypothetical protein